MSSRTAPKQKGVVYVISMKGTSYYKLGWAKNDRNVKIRLARFQTGNPHLLEIQGILKGRTLTDEREIHGTMARHRIGVSEWFEMNPTLQSLIEEAARP